MTVNYTVKTQGNLPMKKLEKVYLSYSDANNPQWVTRIFELYQLHKKMSHVKRNNWTGIGPRRKKIISIIALCDKRIEKILSKNIDHRLNFKIKDFKVRYALEIWNLNK
jgi:tRNA A37 N6-isopentenylltransferase MiaA